MFYNDTLQSSYDAAGKKHEQKLDGIRLDVTRNILAAAVIDGERLIAKFRSRRPLVTSEIEHHGDRYILRVDVAFDEVVKGRRFHVRHSHHAEFAAPLTDSHNHFLLRSATTHPHFVGTFAAHVGFMDFADTMQFRDVYFFHRRPDAPQPTAVQQTAASPLRDSEGAPHAVGADLARFADQVRSNKPFPKGKVCISEQRARRHGDLVAARIAVKPLALAYAGNLVGHTAGIGNHLRPGKSFQIAAALFFTTKLFNQFAGV